MINNLRRKKKSCKLENNDILLWTFGLIFQDLEISNLDITHILDLGKAHNLNRALGVSGQFNPQLAMLVFSTDLFQ